MNKKLLLAIPLFVIAAGIGYKMTHSPSGAATSTLDELPKGASTSSVVSGGAAKVNESAGVTGKTAIVNTTASVPYDPRLANLAVTTDNPTIDYIRGEGGLVVAEIDNDPNNISYKKPLKEYQYYQGKVRTMTRYEYFKTEIVVTTIDVAYKPDGSVLDYREQTATQKLGAKE